MKCIYDIYDVIIYVYININIYLNVRDLKILIKENIVLCLI